MELIYLQTFREVAVRKSFTKAADELVMHNPALPPRFRSWRRNTASSCLNGMAEACA